MPYRPGLHHSFAAVRLLIKQFAKKLTAAAKSLEAIAYRSGSVRAIIIMSVAHPK
jgi:hypothetical protein